MPSEIFVFIQYKCFFLNTISTGVFVILFHCVRLLLNIYLIQKTAPKNKRQDSGDGNTKILLSTFLSDYRNAEIFEH